MKTNTKPPDPVEINLDTAVSIFTKILDRLEPLRSEDVQYYDNADLKKLLHFSDSSLHRLRKAKKIPFKKIGGKIFYPRSFFNNAFKP